MEKVYDICCGIDVHKKLIVACLRTGRKSELREFGATTKELLKLADWLNEFGCEMAAMESTGSYWKPLYNVLEASEIKAIVVNAQHMKAVPGRKTDAKDAEWIADLLQHGLLRASYIPSKEQRELRELTRYRKSLVEERSRELNRLQKMLEGANIKLSGTVSTINGMSARNILNFIVDGGVFSENVFKEMLRKKEISYHLKADPKQLVDDLNGVLSPIQKRMIKELLKHLDELDIHIRNLDDEIDNFMNPEEKDAVKSICEIPGIGETSAKTIISIIGTDMERFPSDRHISKWAGVCPGNNESAKKRKSGRTSKGNPVLRSTLVQCALAAAKRKDSYFSAQYARISTHRGKKRAAVAVAHSLLIAIYHVLKDKTAFRDLGSNYYNQFNKERKANAMVKKLMLLGYTVMLEQAIA